VRAAASQSRCGDVVDLDAIPPLGLGSDEILVHPVEPANQCLIRGIADHGDQVDVADLRFEITPRDRTVDIEADERRSDRLDDRVANDADDRRGVRVELCA
jgi:hypothetical protein